MNKFHQWKTQCPKCGERNTLFVVEITLQENHEKNVLSVQLKPDGFVFEKDGISDHSTQDEKVKCMACGAKFMLADLEINAYYKVDPKALSSHTKPFEFKGNMSEKAFFGLSIQSEALFRAINNAQPRDAKLLEGLMALVDSFRDYAVDNNQYPEDVVFPATNDDAIAIIKETEMEDIDL